MKQLRTILIVLCLASLLSACSGGERRASEPEQGAGAQAAAADAQGPLMTDEAVAAALAEQIPADGAGEDVFPGPVRPMSASLTADPSVDLDLTRLSGTVVYSQVYDMMMQPANYVGKCIRLKGSFSYYRDPNTQKEYFAAVIADATACCAQGIEFVWQGEHVYPQDYPPLDTQITVTGRFSTYYEGDYLYAQLVDAQVEWD